MALDLKLITRLPVASMGGVVGVAITRCRRLDGAIDRALSVPADDAVFRPCAAGRRRYIWARSGPEG